MLTPSILYRSSTQADILLSGQPRPKWTLPQQCPIRLKAYSLDVSYSTRFTSIGTGGPFSINTPASALGMADALAIVAGYSQPQGIGADLGSGNITLAAVPETWDDFRWVPQTFPSFYGGNPIFSPTTYPQYPPNQPPRAILTDIVPVRFRYEYYVVDPAHIISTVVSGTPGTATNLKDTSGAAVKVVYKAGDTPTTRRASFGVNWPGGNTRDNALSNFGGYLTNLQTSPTKEEYQAMMSNALASAWAADLWDGTTGITGSNLFPTAATTDADGYCTVTGLTIGNYYQTFSAVGWAALSPYQYAIYYNNTTASAFSLTDPAWIPIVTDGANAVALIKASTASIKFFMPNYKAATIGTDGTQKFQVFASAFTGHNYGLFQPEDSHIEPYAGNIIARVSLAVMAN